MRKVFSDIKDEREMMDEWKTERQVDRETNDIDTTLCMVE